MAEKEKSWIRPEEFSIADEIAKMNLEHANSVSPLVKVRKSIYVKVVKRFIDIAVSALALVITSPINLILCIATFFDVGRPILYKQKRMGKDFKPFTIIKFRNMTNEKDEEGNLLPPAQRVTKMGKFVRKYSIDELLNFWSVFKGDMSLIGPRPMPVEYVDRMTERHKQRYSIRPGLECPLIPECEKRYPHPEPYSRYQAQFESEIWYVQHVSFATDIKQAFRLIKRVFETKQRAGAASAAAPFIGYDEEGCATSEKHWRKTPQGASTISLKEEID